MKKFLPILSAALIVSGAAFAQTDTTLNGMNLTGTPPSGFVAQPLRFGCIVGTYCWPYMQMWDGTTKATFDPTTGGLKTYVVGKTPDVSSSGTITTADIVTSCTLMSGTNQTQCIGTPTAGSSVSAAINSPGFVSVVSSISGGTANVTLQMEVSEDNGTTWYSDGLYLISSTSPFQKNAIVNPSFSGLAIGGGKTNYRVRATSFSTITGTPVITITIGQGLSTPITYVANLPSASNGISPIDFNLKQQAGQTLAAPTAPGVPAATGLVPTVNAIGNFAFNSFLSNGNYTNIAVTSSSTNYVLNLGGATTAVLFNYGGKSLMYHLSTSSTTVSSATADGILQPGSTQNIGLGTNTNIAVATFNSSSTTSLQIVAGSGVWTGSNQNNFSVTNTGAAASAYANQVGGLDNSSLLQNMQVTAPGTSATNGATAVQGVTNGVPMPTAPILISHKSSPSLDVALSAKTSAGSLLGFNCTAITGSAAGYCIAYNAAATPSTGALTGSLVLDFCYFDTSVRGCSLGRAPTEVAYSAGIQILVSTAVSPYTYTTGTDTAAISADFQ